MTRSRIISRQLATALAAGAIALPAWAVPGTLLAQTERFEAYDPDQPVMTGDEPMVREDMDASGEAEDESRPFSWRLRVSPRVTYSDNVDLAPDDEKAGDGLASVMISGGALVERVRFRGLVNGRIQAGSYVDPPSEDGDQAYDRTIFNHDLSAAGTVNLVDDFLFFDIAAAARQQAPDERTAYSATSLAGNDRLSESVSLSASPYIFIRRPSDDTLEARYRFTGVTVNDSEEVFGEEDYLNDSTSHEVTTEYDSGNLFDRYGFAVKAYGNKTEETGSDVLSEIDYGQASLSADNRYSLNRFLALTGTLGWDFIHIDGDSPFDDGELSGAFWKLGMQATPGRRSQARLEVGERYGGTWLDAEASYRYSSRLQFSLAADRRFMTTAQARAGRFGVLQSETLAYAQELRELQNLTSADILDRVIDYNTGLEDLSRQQAGLSRTDAVYFDTIARTQRSSIVLRAGYDRSDFGFQEVDTASFGILFDRRMSRRLSAYLRGDYQRSMTDFVDDVGDCVTRLSADPATAGLGEEAILTLCSQPGMLSDDADTISLLVGAEWLIYRGVSGFAELNRSQRFSDTASEEYVENAATVGLSFDF